MEKWFFETACFYKAGIKLINEISVRENDNARVQENTEFLNKEWKSTDKNSGMIPIDYCLLFKLRKLYWVLNLQKQCNFLSDAYDLLYNGEVERPQKLTNVQLDTGVSNRHSNSVQCFLTAQQTMTVNWMILKKGWLSVSNFTSRRNPFSAQFSSVIQLRPTLQPSDIFKS